MSFNADAYLAARRPWTLTLGGRTYTGAPVSVGQVLVFQQAVQQAGDDAVAVQAAVRVLLRALFPPRLSYVWLDPVRQVLALDSAAQAAVLADFFGYLARLNTPSVPATPGTTSPTPTPPLTLAGAPG